MSTTPPVIDVRVIPSKKHRKRAKEHQGYDANPPKCLTCKNFAPPIHKGFFQTPYCRIGHFAASPQGVCDLWQGLDGAELER